MSSSGDGPFPGRSKLPTEMAFRHHCLSAISQSRASSHLPEKASLPSLRGSASIQSQPRLDSVYSPDRSIPSLSPCPQGQRSLRPAPRVPVGEGAWSGCRLSPKEHKHRGRASRVSPRSAALPSTPTQLPCSVCLMAAAQGHVGLCLLRPSARHPVWPQVKDLPLCSWASGNLAPSPALSASGELTEGEAASGRSVALTTTWCQPPGKQRRPWMLNRAAGEF